MYHVPAETGGFPSLPVWAGLLYEVLRKCFFLIHLEGYRAQLG